MVRKLHQSAPLLRIAVSLVVGIAVAARWPVVMPVVLLLLALAVAVAFTVGRWPVVQSTMICASFVFTGMAAYGWSSTADGNRSGAVGEWFLDRREALLERYRMATDDDDAYAVLAAMTLGDKSALTRGLRETYSVTGASHVLALSGLHLSIIYMLLSWMLMGRRGYVVSQVVIILGLWGYALLTGLSTSVVRASTMLSLYAVFTLGDRGRSPLNVLSFTAIVLLLIDARMLFDVGFQMSFMAVLSILLFMPLFDGLMPMPFLIRHRALRWVYSLTAVSLAAQLGVAPLIAFYFHRFSTYFLIANFVVIPLATLILYGALVTFAVPALGGAVAWLAGCMNAALKWLSGLPLSSIDDLHISGLQLLLIYVVVGCFYVLLRVLHVAQPAQDVVEIGNDHQ